MRDLCYSLNTSDLSVIGAAGSLKGETGKNEGTNADLCMKRM